MTFQKRKQTNNREGCRSMRSQNTGYLLFKYDQHKSTQNLEGTALCASFIQYGALVESLQH